MLPKSDKRLSIASSAFDISRERTWPSNSPYKSTKSFTSSNSSTLPHTWTSNRSPTLAEPRNASPFEAESEKDNCLILERIPTPATVFEDPKTPRATVVIGPTDCSPLDKHQRPLKPKRSLSLEKAFVRELGFDERVLQGKVVLAGKITPQRYETQAETDLDLPRPLKIKAGCHEKLHKKGDSWEIIDTKIEGQGW